MVNKKLILVLIVLLSGLFISHYFFAIALTNTNLPNIDYGVNKPLIVKLCNDNDLLVTLSNVKWELYGPEVNTVEYNQPLRDGVIGLVSITPNSCSEVSVNINSGSLSVGDYHFLVLPYVNGERVSYDYSAFDETHNPNNLNGGGIAWSFSVVKEVSSECSVNIDCDDGNPCTQDLCGEQGSCGFLKLNGDQSGCQGFINNQSYRSCVNGECVLFNYGLINESVNQSSEVTACSINSDCGVGLSCVNGDCVNVETIKQSSNNDNSIILYIMGGLLLIMMIRVMFK